ncbi:mRNA cleavage and polyadenylation factor subunit [Batrachochytrium dendrobatidis]|nr:mRNA cleavage and polyadenylation factor subunit [Batrachochytrium dendrobatidis]KAK5668554.1 mRNA cleavage and polyadenylation factor subunit [Batrachochytrium dendrobatidis]
MSNNLYSLCKEIFPPSGIDYAVSARFLTPDARNVVIARGSLLQVFKVIERDTTVAFSSSLNNLNSTDLDTNGDQAKTTKDQDIPPKAACLELAAQFRVHGNITSLGVVPMNYSGKADALLLSFKEAKMSLVEYSQFTQKLVTVSMHYFEREEFKKLGSIDRPPPEIKVDPQGYCAAMRIYGDRLAILPFKQDGADLLNDLNDANSKYPFRPSIVLPFLDLDKSIRNIIDFTFLFGYAVPTIAIMYQTEQTWTARLGIRKDTVSIAVISLDTAEESYPVLYKIEKLPYNCTMLVSVPTPIGGLIVLSHNAIIFTDQIHAPGIACIVNAYFDSETNIMLTPYELQLDMVQPRPPRPPSVFFAQNKYTDYKELAISLDGSRGMFISPDIFLLVLRDGEMIQVDLIGEEGVGRSWKRRKGGVKSFQLTRLGIRMTAPVHLFPLADASNPLSLSGRNSSVPLGGSFLGSRGSKLRYNYLFASSRTTDACLLQFVEVEEFAKSSVSMNGAANMNNTDNGEDDELDKDLYGDSTTAKQTDTDMSALLSSDEHGHGEIVSEQTLRFRLCDSVTVVSPLRDFAVGLPAETSEHRFSPKIGGCDLEIVAATGHGPHGHLAILNRSVRPQIVTTFELPQIEEMWTIRCAKFDKDYRLVSEPTDAFHKYVILSHSSGTSILKAGEAFTEMDDTTFYQAGPTVGVGALLDETIIVQVHPNGVILFDFKGTKLQEMRVGDDDIWVISCSFMDPYAMLLMNTGHIVLLSLDETTHQITQISEYKKRLVSTFSLYCDPTGGTLLPTNELASVSHASLLTSVAQRPFFKSSSSASKRLSQPDHSAMNLDDDADLYGTSHSHNKNTNVADIEMDDIYGDSDQQISNANTSSSAADKDMMPDTFPDANDFAKRSSQNSTKPSPTYWCFVYTDTGHLLVYTLPDFKECCAFPLFSTLPVLAMDVPLWRSRSIDSTFANTTGDEFEEILVVNLGNSKDRQTPYLVCLAANGDLAVYKIFVCPTSSNDDDTSFVNSGTFKQSRTPAELELDAQNLKKRLAIRLVRIPHDQITRDLQFYTDNEGDKIDLVQEPQHQPTFLKRQHLKPFDAIGWSGGNMYSGVVVTGSRPCWIMVALQSRQQDLDVISFDDSVACSTKLPPVPLLGTNMLRFHPMPVDGPMKCFAPLHNVNVAHGFLYINWKGLFRICQLPPQFNFDHDWPVCKVPIHKTVHKVAYHYSSQTYAIATSTPERFDIPHAQYASAVAAAVIDEGDEMPDAERKVTGIRELSEIKPGMYEATVDRYKIELVSSVTWETVDSIELSEAETVMALEAVDLSSKETISGKKLYLAIGTGYSRGEDLSSRGKLHLYDVIEVVPDPNNPQTNRKFKHVDSEDDRSPFSAICTVNDYLLAAIGPKIIMYQLEDGEITGVAFLDVNVFVTSLSSVKNLIQICDIQKSVWFVAFQEEPAKLAVLGRDVHPLQGYAANMLIDDNQLALLVADGDKNLHTMIYAPDNVQSLGGERLIRKGEIHLGQHVSKFIRMRRKPLLRNDAIVFSKQYLNVAATLDGALEIITPVSERIFKRLYGLYSRMVTSIEHIAGLNPRGFRQAQHRVRPITLSGFIGPPGPRGILDGDLLYEYVRLSRTQQRGLAKAIGSKDDRLMDDLLEVLTGLDFF